MDAPRRPAAVDGPPLPAVAGRARLGARRQRPRPDVERVAPHHLPQPRVVAQGGAEAAADRRGAGVVDGQQRVALRADRRPQLARDQLGQRRAAEPLGDDAEQVGVRRRVVEALAVRPRRGPDRRQELEDRRGYIRVRRVPGARGVVAPEVRVVLDEVDRRRHVQQMPHGRALVAAARDLGHGLGHRRLRVEPHAQHHQPEHGLADRLREVQRRVVHPVAVALLHELAVAQHRQPVEVRRVLDRERFGLRGQLEDRPVAPRHDDRRHHFADVLVGPAVPRADLPRLQRHLHRRSLWRRRGCPGNPAAAPPRASRCPLSPKGRVGRTRTGGTAGGCRCGCRRAGS